MRRLAAVLAVLASGCLPNRDNPRDPINRPEPAIEVRVGGAASTAGSRRADWVLDGSESVDTNGNAIDEFTWDLSTGAADPSDLELVPGWTLVGTAGTVSTGLPGGELLAAALAGITDFNAGATGIAERTLRLSVKDSRGRRAHKSARITVVNAPPSVSLGPDRRIAPGGMYWEVDPNDIGDDVNGDTAVDIFDAPTFDVVIRASIDDPDPGDAATIATEAYPARWEVRGTLARILDIDRDGNVDDAFFTDEGHRELRLPAPITPESSELEIFVADVIQNGALTELPSGTDTLGVAVGSSTWTLDGATGFLHRLQRRSFEVLAAPAPIGSGIVATGNGKALFYEVRFDGGLGQFVASLTWADHTLALIGNLDIVFGQATPTILGAPDADRGWWVIANEALYHFDHTLSPIAAPVTDLDGGGPDLANVSSIVAGTDGRLWILAGSDPAALRLFTRGPGAGAQWTSATPFPDTRAGLRLIPDGADGIVVLGDVAGSASTLRFARRLDPAGSELFDRDILVDGESVGFLAYDPVLDSFWGSYDIFGNFFYYFRWTVDGGVYPIDAPGIGALRDFYVDRADGSALFATENGIVRGTPTGSGAQPFIVMTTAEGVPENRNLLEARFFDQGSWVAVLAAPTGAHYFQYAESPALDTPVELPLSFAYTGNHLAVDPTTGFVWAYLPESVAIVELAPTGERLRTVPLPVGGLSPNDLTVNAAVDVDLANRRVWVAFVSYATGPGPFPSGLYWFDLDAETPTLVQIQGDFAFFNLNEIDVTSAGDVCIAGLRESQVGLEDALVVQIAAGGSSGTIVPVLVNDYMGTVSTVAAHRDGACWFTTDYSGFDPTGRQIVRVPQGGGTPLRKNVGDRNHRSITFDHWSGAVWAPTYSHFDTDYLVLSLSLSPGVDLLDPFLDPAEPEPFPIYPASTHFDPFFRHLYLGFEDNAFVPDTVRGVIRLNTSQTEIDRHTQITYPRLLNSH